MANAHLAILGRCSAHFLGLFVRRMPRVRPAVAQHAHADARSRDDPQTARLEQKQGSQGWH